MNENNRYDIIIIGSGIGSLATGSIMAQMFSKRVLVLEQHFQLGGFTHSFRRGKYKWDVGLHYIGRMTLKEMPRQVMDFITGGRLKWHSISEPFEAFIYPDLYFEVYGEPEKHINSLVQQFPDEEKAIRNYFKDIFRVTRWFRLYFLTRCLPKGLTGILSRLLNLTGRIPLTTTSDYLENHFRNRKLRALLTSQWGSYGMPPSSSSFIIHSIVMTHFINGGFYPDGGADRIAETIAPEIEKAGGACLTNHQVTRVITENGTAVGVVTKSKKGEGFEEKRFSAPVIVSGIGAYNTFMKIVPETVHVPFRRKLAAMPESSTVVTLFLGLSESPASLGIRGEHFWIYGSFDHEKNFRNDGLLKGSPDFCYLSFPSLRGSEEENHTAVIIASVSYNVFEKWNQKTWKKRTKEYYRTKETITRGLVRYVEKRIPGFSDLIVFKELATPLSNEYFTHHTNGSIYGLAATPYRYRQDWLHPETPVKNLFLTGADICSLGVVCSMMSGVATASRLNGTLGLFKLIGKLRKHNSRKR